MVESLPPTFLFMVSFLIPIYNYNIVALAQNLCKQAEQLSIDYELLAIDDCSPNETIKQENKAIENLPNTRYILLNTNFGRSKIRNFLANEAKGDWLLFLDCDTEIIKDNFVKSYLDNTDKADVICGGIAYKDIKDVEKQFLLHTLFGTKRESHKNHFMTGNFFIKKEIFSVVNFNENILGYGHEDTLFGIELKDKNYTILCIDNSILHLGLKNTDKFIEDTIQACINLKKLYKNPDYHNKLQNLHIIKTYNKLHFKPLYRLILNWLQPFCKQQLKSDKPKLFFLDLIKLNAILKK